MSRIHVEPDPLALLILRDISERKRAEEARHKLQEQAYLVQKLDSLSTLAGGVAHDFNNLLTAILGYTDLAMRELPPGRAREYLTETLQGARKAAELTQYMLAYSGKGRFVVVPLSLSALVEDLRPLLQATVSSACTLRFDLATALPAIEADPAQVRQVLLNLVLNASEALGNRPGTVTLRTSLLQADRAYLSATYLDENLAEGPYVLLEVADTGCGMDATTREKIFEPFFTTKFPGRGLGLAAVLGIVRGHHGAVRVASEVGQGTTMQVLFPVAADSPCAPVTAGEAEWRGSGLVLVIDDEDAVRNLACCLLRAMGFTVLSAADGREGVEVFRVNRNRLRLVLLDLTMPRMDGEATFREMLALGPRVPTILTSGYAEQATTGRFTGLGLAGFLQKPYRFDDLRQVVRQALEEAQGDEKSRPRFSR